MPNKSASAEIRRQHMLALIRSREFARVDDLVTQFSVSSVTVRSDLSGLERAGMVRRVRGGVVARPLTSLGEPTFEESLTASADEKRLIGEAAADTVESGMSVLIDVGTTTTAVAEALLARVDLEDVVVMTNALNIALLLEQAGPRISVVVTGGTLRRRQHSLVAPLAREVLSKVHADISFIGCNGVDIAHGVTNANLPEAEIKGLMIESAERSVVVADSSKIGKRHLARVAELAEIDILVTSADADPEWVREAESAGPTVIAI